MTLLAATLEVWFVRAILGCAAVAVLFVVIALGLLVYGYWSHRRERKDWE